MNSFAVHLDRRENYSIDYSIETINEFSKNN